MKKIMFIIVFLGGSIVSFSQEKSVQSLKAKEVKKNAPEEINSSQTIHTSVSIGEKKEEPKKDILYWKNYILAIESKIESVKANINEKTKAENSGWFIEMEENIDKAKIEIQKLETNK